MKNGQKYAKEINKMVNQEFFECSLWSIRNGKRASEDCRHIPESFDPASGPVSGRNEFCKKCLAESLEWLNEKYNEPILTDDEKDIVKAMCDAIYRFGYDEVISVCKISFGMRCNFISISYKNEYSGVNETMSSPTFRNDLFAGMELRKRYSLEELGITCTTQKDS